MIAPDAMVKTAMIAAVTDLAGNITGAHRTWLAPDGTGKALVDRPRRAMGNLLGHGVRFGMAREVLVAGEGIETMLSVGAALPGLPIVAAQNRFDGHAAGDKAGRRREGFLRDIRGGVFAGPGKRFRLDRERRDGNEHCSKEKLQSHFQLFFLLLALRSRLARGPPGQERRSIGISYRGARRRADIASREGAP